MLVSELLSAGAELMLLGMGIVFSFLVMLVFTLKGMTRLAAWLDDGQETVATPAYPQTQVQDTTNDTALIAVISAAVARYRAGRT